MGRVRTANEPAVQPAYDSLAATLAVLAPFTRNERLGCELSFGEGPSLGADRLAWVLDLLCRCVWRERAAPGG